MLYSHGAILTAGADLSSEMLRSGLACCEAVLLVIRWVMEDCVEYRLGYAQLINHGFRRID